MRKITEKKERYLGVKLFLKPERCSSPKCVMIRRPYRPGVHGAKRRGPVSDYGRQLREKQKIQIVYGLTNRQMCNLFKEPLGKILLILEQRLDRVVYLLGLAPSPRVARQFISHGHIQVNQRKVTIPSFHVKVGDIVGIRPESRKAKIFEGLPEKLKQYQPPAWLELNKEELKGKCVANPRAEEINLGADANLVGQFYSR
ncbi:MAG: 30S ribosomal protein S4 [Candidatus Jorgensenbacteria bacterium GW2011_GWA1_48_13]|uniref:Small ribosomal subunit protein uS4 n=2 Tax=Candidatus Joergenseniibacteriota TaxID=1752739 RepID=A0A0G1W9N7_9BACT|nr:MAG: 30S ribosomal protein S4 [Candidatus Jorgensenbacteria bacterium GW2011_GWA1_48_13]KKU99107.1 MAG: 30S ribosomal protein S4 [Candidatus Jorgensenbacteria bacterium GW2011_GWC1_48_8]KKW15483.1 MAG: 30S ribosomal protein S4 [Candidatus Jorgensenbacteria bacterium GW2011_GWB1_50_10]